MNNKFQNHKSYYNRPAMLEPLKQFICDTCGNIIEKPEDGWVEWLSKFDKNKGKFINKGFRVCHHESSCMKFADHEDSSDNHLQNMLKGNVFVLQLYGMLDPGPYITPEYYRGPEVEEIREVVEMLRRFTLPYYEEARLYFPDANADGRFENSNEPFAYLPHKLKNIIEDFS